MYNIHLLYSLILEFRAFGFVYIISDALWVFGSLSGFCLAQVLKWCQRRPALVGCHSLRNPPNLLTIEHWSRGWYHLISKEWWNIHSAWRSRRFVFNIIEYFVVIVTRKPISALVVSPILLRTLSPYLSSSTHASEAYKLETKHTKETTVFCVCKEISVQRSVYRP